MFFKADERLSEVMKNESEQGGEQDTGRWQSSKETQDPEVGHWESSHVSFLTFKSLVQLRRTMDSGEESNIIRQRIQL